MRPWSHRLVVFALYVVFVCTSTGTVPVCHARSHRKLVWFIVAYIAPTRTPTITPTPAPSQAPSQAPSDTWWICISDIGMNKWTDRVSFSLCLHMGPSFHYRRMCPFVRLCVCVIMCGRRRYVIAMYLTTLCYILDSYVYVLRFMDPSFHYRRMCLFVRLCMCVIMCGRRRYVIAMYLQRYVTY